MDNKRIFTYQQSSLNSTAELYEEDEGMNRDDDADISYLGKLNLINANARLKLLEANQQIVNFHLNVRKCY
jgi:hypothetical protein